MCIGSNIKKIRELKEMSQKELSEATGLSTVTIYNYETNKRKPTLKNILKVSEALEIDMNTLTSKYETNIQRILNNLLFEKKIKLDEIVNYISSWNKTSYSITKDIVRSLYFSVCESDWTIYSAICSFGGIPYEDDAYSLYEQDCDYYKNKLLSENHKEILEDNIKRIEDSNLSNFKSVLNVNNLDGLPQKAIDEINDYIKYIKHKYQVSDDDLPF